MQSEPTTPVTTQINATGPGGTELDLVLADIPWGDAFAIGAGVDAVTGSVMASALKPVTLLPASIIESPEQVKLIQSASDMSSEIEASLSGKFNIEGIPVTASASALTQVRYSETSATLIAQYEATAVTYEEATEYELTEEAKKLMDTPAAFRDAYGDYFVAGGRRTSRFTAVYACRAATASDLSQFTATLGADVELGSAQLNAKFTKAVSTRKIHVDVSVFMEGYEDVAGAPGSPWTLEKVQSALEWFKKYKKGIYLQAKLKHYKTLAPLYPRIVDVDPSAFADVRYLHTTLLRLRAQFYSCPPKYQAAFQQQFTALDVGIVADQEDLPRNAAKRDKYREQLASLMTQLDVVVERMAFYQKVKAAVATEPTEEVAVPEGTTRQSWPYGFEAYPQSAAVVIHPTPFHYKGQGTTLGQETHAFEYKSHGKSLIVGWEIISEYHDGSNGSWTKGTDQILLKDYAAVSVTANFNRCLNWSFVVYTVNAADYQFE